MWFTHKKVPPIGLISQGASIVANTAKKTFIGVSLSVLLFFWLYIYWYIDTALNGVKNLWTNVIVGTSTQIAQTFWKDMQKDEYGNINILLVWYWGDAHQGWYLADSIIVVSYDPKLHSSVFLSLPRDLIINLSWYINKINAVMPYKYNRTKDIGVSALALAKKTEEITSLSIPYYALIDFNGFADLVDSIWGIDVVVPKKIYDTSYPWPNRSYTIFSLNAGAQHLDGATALKYARSRHSTSDFSRSQRQQLIIKAIMEKIIQGKTLSISMVKDLYQTYNKMVTTNISLDEMIGLIQYSKSIPEIHSFWYTMECSNQAWKTMKAACLLYPVNSEDFNGMAWILPIGASISKISYYDYTQYFGDLVAHNQEYLNEKLPIEIYNAADKAYARKFAYRNGISGKLAVKLKRNWFLVDAVENADAPSTGTKAVVYSNNNSEETLRMLRLYVNIDEVEQHPAEVNWSGEVLPAVLKLYLGNNYLDQVWSKPFNYYK